MSALLSPTFLAHPTSSYEEFLRDKVAFDKRELDAAQVTPTLFDLLDLEGSAA